MHPCNAEITAPNDQPATMCALAPALWYLRTYLRKFCRFFVGYFKQLFAELLGGSGKLKKMITLLSNESSFDQKLEECWKQFNFWLASTLTALARKVFHLQVQINSENKNGSGEKNRSPGSDSTRSASWTRRSEIPGNLLIQFRQKQPVER